MRPHAGERLERLRRLKAQFDEVHKRGMAALNSGDYSALGTAIREEKAILDEQTALIAEARAEIAEMLKKHR